MDTLETLRQQIDDCDKRLIALLEERLAIVEKIGHFKQNTNTSIYRPEREKSIIENLSKLDNKYLNKDSIGAIFYEIFAISRNIEMPQKIAYLGPLGSYTHQIAMFRFGALSQYISLTNIRSIFKAIELGRAKYGVAPIENNINGIVGESIDALANSELKIVAEATMEIHHSLCSNAQSLKDVKKIYSKNIAFGQCKEFLDTHGLDKAEFINVESTAKAAELCIDKQDSAAICSKIASKIYNLPVMFENIEDSKNNKTRFIIISDFNNAPSGEDKTSVFVSLSDFGKAGALLRLLEDFKAYKINILKIDSRPLKIRDDFRYGFFMEFDGHKDDRHIQKLFKKRQSEIKWLGSYPKEKTYE